VRSGRENPVIHHLNIFILSAFASPQSLREEHQGYEKELCRLRAHYEEEMHRFKEAQVRALEELEENHQSMREEAQKEDEDEKRLLMAVSPMSPRLKNTSTLYTRVHYSTPIITFQTHSYTISKFWSIVAPVISI